VAVAQDLDDSGRGRVRLARAISALHPGPGDIGAIDIPSVGECIANAFVCPLVTIGAWACALEPCAQNVRRHFGLTER
jgi:hypothetical protein